MSHARRAPLNYKNALGYGHEDTLARRSASARRHGHGHVIFYIVLEEIHVETTREQEGLLQRIRVLDLADEKASYCSKLLADLGASVIKIEKPGGDPSRQMGPFSELVPSAEGSLFFWHSNTNKQGITLDIEKTEGKELFLGLLKTADVVVESFAPGYLQRLGLGFDVLSERNPEFILVSVTGSGQNGPRNQYRSCDLVTSAFGGQMFVSGSPTTPPLKPYGEQSSYLTSLFSAIAVLLALRKRRLTGRGQHIDISSQECVASTLDHVLVRYFYDHVIPARSGSVSWNNTSFILPCQDGHIHLSIAVQWETLVEWMAAEGMAEDLLDEKWKDQEVRLKNIDHVIAIVQRWTRTHTVRELFELGQTMRFPWAPVSSPDDVLQSPQLEARAFFTDVEHPELGTTLRYPGPPYTLNPPLKKRWKRAPLVGEDNAQIYEGELGLSTEEVQRLSSMKVI
jgi:benzylsuccinate CoA-transferase BbsE subunit